MGGGRGLAGLVLSQSDARCRHLEDGMFTWERTSLLGRRGGYTGLETSGLCHSSLFSRLILDRWPPIDDQDVNLLSGSALPLAGMF